MFVRLAPVYMAMGMSYDEYWNGDNDAPRQYLKADRLRRRRKNQELWLQGLYIYRAIHALSPELNAASKDFKPEPYMKDPIPIDDYERKEQEKESHKAEAQMLAQWIIGQSAKAMKNKEER